MISRDDIVAESIVAGLGAVTEQGDCLAGQDPPGKGMDGEVGPLAGAVHRKET
jgi:hypothetical protein